MITGIASAAAEAAADATCWAALKTLKFVWPLVDGIAYPIVLCGGGISLLVWLATRDARYSRFTGLLIIVYLAVKMVGKALLTC